MTYFLAFMGSVAMLFGLVALTGDWRAEARPPAKHGFVALLVGVGLVILASLQ